MSEPVKILSFELENVKRVQAVSLTPSANGLTVIGGGNRQGKTSVLDAIAFGLGGERNRPTNLQREGGVADARIEVTLSNGLKVERKGKNAALKVIDPSGQKGGQKLLDSFIDELALDMPKFLAMKGADKADVLLRILGIGDQLAALETEERKYYEERTLLGRIADQKQKFFQELPWNAVPEVPITAAELVQQSQAILGRNAEKANQRRAKVELRGIATTLTGLAESKGRRAAELERMLKEAWAEWTDAKDKASQAIATADQAETVTVVDDESTVEIEGRMTEIEAVNAKVRENLNKAKAKDDAEEAGKKADTMTAKVEDVRIRRKALLDGAAMPLPGLSVEGGELTYNGKAWDCMSGTEQIRAGIAIVQKLKPECGFVLLDKLEAFDLVELAELASWLKAQGLQAIATRVSKGHECSIIIEDGLVAVNNMTEAETVQNTEEKEENW